MNNNSNQNAAPARLSDGLGDWAIFELSTAAVGGGVGELVSLGDYDYV